MMMYASNTQELREKPTDDEFLNYLQLLVGEKGHIMIDSLKD